MTNKDKILAAKSLIDTVDKWAQGPGIWGSDRHCAQQAMLDANAGWLMDELAKHLPVWYTISAWCRGRWSILSSSNIIRFNDHPKTTHSDVVALFDRAIEAAS